MKPFERASRIVRRIARQTIAREIEREIAHAEADACCAAAAEIDSRVLAGKLHNVSEASAVCRELAELHIKDCIGE